MLLVVTPCALMTFLQLTSLLEIITRHAPYVDGDDYDHNHKKWIGLELIAVLSSHAINAETVNDFKVTSYGGA